jgi:hypothetical protein
MRRTVDVPLSNPFAAPGYGLLAGSLAVSAALLAAGPRWALLPAAVVFGWSQIGGL